MTNAKAAPNVRSKQSTVSAIASSWQRLMISIFTSFHVARRCEYSARRVSPIIRRVARMGSLPVDDRHADHKLSAASPARTWVATLIVGSFFILFAAIDWMMIRRIGATGRRDVFDLMFVLFESFWVLGWSVAVITLGLLTAFLLFASASEQFRNQLLGRILRAIPERASSGIAARPIPASAPAAPPPYATDTTGRIEVSPRWSEFALVAANLVPLAGVLMLGWDLKSIMVLYWAETAAIGIFTVLKMFVVSKWRALFSAPFFIAHFGGFMTMHFLFLYAFFIRGMSGGSLGAEPDAREALVAIFLPLWRPLAAMTISHGVSFVDNFIGRKEYETATMSGLMTAPYNRIMVMHMTILFGGWLVMLFRAPATGVALLVVLKTMMDWRAHRAEHRPVSA
jgi:hypothetical protein